MNKDTGKKEAGNFPKHNTLIMIVSILTVTLFVGLAVQPAISQKVPAEVIPTEIEEECIPCKVAEPQNTKPPCTTCACAIDIAVVHALEYTATKVYIKMEKTENEIYSGFFIDLALWIKEGIIEGIAKSGFEFDINIIELGKVCLYWAREKYVIPDHDLAKISAALQGVLKGIGEYLIDVCNNRSQDKVYETTVIPIIPPPVKPLYPLKNLLSLFQKAQTGDVCHRCKNIEQIISYNGNGPISRIIFVILKHIIA